jgi:hypothetical protein
MKAILTFMVFLPLAAPAVGFFRTVPVRSASISGVEASNSATCVERYNTLLMQAKEAVTTGDRAATVEFLHQAKRVLARCPALQNGSSPRAAALALNTF